MQIMSVGMRLKQPIALAWAIDEDYLRDTQQVSHRGLWKPNCGGSGCLASKEYKDVYISPSR
jgi:hypothetical protein